MYTDKLSITGSTVKKLPDQLARSNFSWAVFSETEFTTKPFGECPIREI